LIGKEPIKTEPMNPNFYFLEKGKKVYYLEGHGADVPHFENKIFIEEMNEFFSKYGIKGKKSLKDIYDFDTNTVEFTVWLRNEDGYYDDEEKDNYKNLDEYTRLLRYLTFLAIKPLGDKEKKMIKATMDKYHLNVFHPDKQKRFTDVEELAKYIESYGLFAKPRPIYHIEPMDKGKLLERLAKYASVMEESYRSTNNANHRQLYLERFHFVVKFLAAVHSGDVVEQEDVLGEEKHCMGWSFLPGQEGARVAEAWTEFLGDMR